MAWREVWSEGVGRIQAPSRACFPDAVLVGEAVHAAGFFPHGAQVWQEQTGQNGDDGDNHQQFHQCERAFRNSPPNAFHDVFLHNGQFRSPMFSVFLFSFNLLLTISSSLDFLISFPCVFEPDPFGIYLGHCSGKEYPPLRITVHGYIY